MSTSKVNSDKPTIIGRSSSHFTRVVRIFAAELRVDHSFRIVRDLLSTDVADYGGHPALRVPALQTAAGTWFGALNICRELSRLSSERVVILWPEALHESVPANAQELILQAMAAEVGLIMHSLGAPAASNAYQEKTKAGLRNILAWLEVNIDAVLDGLPPRDLSFLEVALFGLVEHLEFRKILSMGDYPQLDEFRRQFASRPSAAATLFKFD